MMTRFALLGLLLLGFLSVYCQTTIAGKYDFIDCDNQGNIYLSENLVLKKYSPTGKEMFSFSNPMLGFISSVDATNVLKVLAFYKGSQKLLVLDHQLTQQGDAFAFSQDYDPLVVCSSPKGGFWFFDDFTNALIEMDWHGKVQKQSGSLGQQCKGANVVQLCCSSSYLFLLLNNASTLCFDTFGNYLARLPIKPDLLAGCQQETIFYTKGKVLGTYNLKTQVADTLVVAQAPILAVSVVAQQYMTESKMGLEIFKFPLPLRK